MSGPAGSGTPERAFLEVRSEEFLETSAFARGRLLVIGAQACYELHDVNTEFLRIMVQ